MAKKKSAPAESPGVQAQSARSQADPGKGVAKTERSPPAKGKKAKGT